MPPETPSTTRGAADTAGSGFDGLGGEQVGVDLAQRDGQRLLLRNRLDQRADVLQQALAELAVVGVDLAGTLGREDHQRVLRGGLLQQLVDGRVGNAFRVRDCHGVAPQDVWWEDPIWAKGLTGWPANSSTPAQSSNPTNSSAARCTESLTTTRSNSDSAAISSCACSRRRRMVSASSVPRPIRRRCNSSQLGGARNTSCASGMATRTWRAPCRSIFNSAGMPAAMRASTGPRGVP